MTAQQLRKLVGNKSLQVIYEDVRKMRDKQLVESIVYGGVSRSGTMQKLNYLTRKGAGVIAEAEGIEIDKVRFPKSNSSLVKNDFIHRKETISLMIAFDQWITDSGFEKLFFDVYFDTIGSQRKQDEGALRSRTRMNLGSQTFVDPDGIFAYESTS